jgi:hypothetical protein
MRNGPNTKSSITNSGSLTPQTLAVKLGAGLVANPDPHQDRLFVQIQNSELRRRTALPPAKPPTPLPNPTSTQATAAMATQAKSGEVRRSVSARSPA